MYGNCGTPGLQWLFSVQDILKADSLSVCLSVCSFLSYFVRFLFFLFCFKMLSSYEYLVLNFQQFEIADVMSDL